MGSAALRGLLWVVGLGLAASVFADIGGRQVELAATGRFDELEALMEGEQARHPLETPDLHALCYAYSKTKRYDRLSACLDKLEQTLARGPRHTRLFGLDDATPSLHLMRAVTHIELEHYDEAVADSQKVMEWMERDRGYDKDMEIEALAVRSIAATLAGRAAEGEREAVRLEKVSVAWPLGSDYAAIKAMALARAWSALGRYDKALAAIRADGGFEFKVFLDNLVSGAALRGESNWLWAELPRAFLINHALLETGDPAAAKAGFDKLLGNPAVAANGEIYWLVLFDRGRIAEGEGKGGEAMDYYRRAIEIIERQRSTINTEAAKIGFVADKQAVYARAVALAISSGQPARAFEFVERAKARALVDLLAAKDDFAAPGAAGQKLAALLAEMRAGEGEARVQVGQTRSSGGESRAGRPPKVAQAQAALSSISPELASLIVVSALSTEDVQSRLPPDEEVLEYYASGGGLYAITVSRGKVTGVKLDSSGLEALVRKFRQDVEARAPGVEAEARQLYDRLLRPVEASLSAPNLLIIPHGVLHYVSFGALHDGKDYWLSRKNMRFLPSASVVRYLRPPSGKPVGDLLAIGNPDLKDARFDLPSAEQEARGIGQAVRDATVLTRAQATETAFRGLAGSERYVHIASHGEYNAEDALQSRLLLAADGKNDGALTTSELYGLRLNADLVTLSACETGLGRVLTGDDVIGLTRGFLYAGASNVVASLWQVDDDATTQLMSAFYRNMTKGLAKSEALRQAQLEVRKKWPHPFFWGAFFLTGRG
jgi:CHAT domain-containing protein/tetratricopeptide (TPR) repeat protein